MHDGWGKMPARTANIGTKGWVGPEMEGDGESFHLSLQLNQLLYTHTHFSLQKQAFHFLKNDGAWVRVGLGWGGTADAELIVVGVSLG